MALTILVATEIRLTVTGWRKPYGDSTSQLSWQQQPVPRRCSCRKADEVAMSVPLADMALDEEVPDTVVGADDGETGSQGRGARCPGDGPRVVDARESGNRRLYFARRAAWRASVMRCAPRFAGQAAAVRAGGSGSAQATSALGRISRATASTAAAQLTPASVKVCRILRSGMTNRQIARALDSTRHNEESVQQRVGQVVGATVAPRSRRARSIDRTEPVPLWFRTPWQSGARIRILASLRMHNASRAGHGPVPGQSGTCGHRRTNSRSH